MAGTEVDVGTGTTLVGGTSGWTAQILSYDWSGISRESIDTSHMGTAAAGAGKIANKTSIPGDLTDPGELEVEFHFNPDTTPPTDAVAETWTLTFDLFAGDATEANWACSGFMTSFRFGVPLDDKMVGTATLKLSGNITITAATT